MATAQSDAALRYETFTECHAYLQEQKKADPEAYADIPDG